MNIHEYQAKSLLQKYGVAVRDLARWESGNWPHSQVVAENGIPKASEKKAERVILHL